MTTQADLRAAVAARYVVVNGAHAMTPADDAYVDEWYVSLLEHAAERGIEPDEIRADMLAHRLPLPSYLRSDGVEMLHRDYFDLTDTVGVHGLRALFDQEFAEPDQADEEWASYLSGQYVCLHSVTPVNIKHKGELVAEIRAALAEPQPDSNAWLNRLHAAVDRLDTLSPPYTGYDELRFGGPTGRQEYIDAVRAKFPRPSR